MADELVLESVADNVFCWPMTTFPKERFPGLQVKCAVAPAIPGKKVANHKASNTVRSAGMGRLSMALGGQAMSTLWRGRALEMKVPVVHPGHDRVRELDLAKLPHGWCNGSGENRTTQTSACVVRTGASPSPV
jgi:hypothetical protein